MATPIVLTQASIDKNHILISSEHTTFCHVVAYTPDDFKLKEALTALQKYAAANKIRLNGLRGVKAQVEAFEATLPRALEARQAIFDELSTGWTAKLAAGLYTGFTSDDAYNALEGLQERITETTYRNTVIGRAIELMSRLNQGTLVRPGSTIYL